MRTKIVVKQINENDRADVVAIRDLAEGVDGGVVGVAVEVVVLGEDHAGVSEVTVGAKVIGVHAVNHQVTVVDFGKDAVILLRRDVNVLAGFVAGIVSIRDVVAAAVINLIGGSISGELAVKVEKALSFVDQVRLVITESLVLFLNDSMHVAKDVVLGVKKETNEDFFQNAVGLAVCYRVKMLIISGINKDLCTEEN